MDVIDLDALVSPTEKVSLGERGLLEVRTMDGAGEHALRAALIRPGRTRAGAFAEEVLSRCSNLTQAEVRSLSPAHRRRLAAAIVRANDWQHDWTALYGSYLNADERLLAVASWSYKRSQSEVLTRLREIRRRHLQDAEKRAAALGVAQLAPFSEAAAKAQRLVAGQQQVTRAANALANINKLVGYGGATRGLLAATRPNPALLAISKPPFYLAAVAPPPSIAAAVRGVSGLSDAVLGLDRTRAAITSVTRGLAFSKTVFPRVDVPGFAIPRGAVINPGLADALAGTKTLTGISDAWRTISSGFLGDAVSARIARSVSPFAPFEAFRAWQDQFAETWAAVDEFLAAWEDEALWYLFSTLSIAASAKLGKLRRDEVEAVVFDALEQVFNDPDLLGAFIEHLDQVPDLAGPHRDQMRQALEFVRAGAYHLAQPLLHVAFESMLYQGALSRGLIQPGKGKIAAAESILRILFTSGDLFLNFTLRMVFGGLGNSYRHGRNPDGHRELMLAGLVALAGYMDWTTGTHAIEIVATRMERQLDPAIERLGTARQTVLTAGS